MSFFGTFKTDLMMKKSWWISMWRVTPPKGVKVAKFVNAVFVLAGVLFLVFALYQLSTGTFKWRGDPKTYSFSDFFK